MEWWKEGDKQREAYIQSFYVLSQTETLEPILNLCPEPLRCCHKSFTTQLDYEAHYELTHHYRCSSCHVSWINPRLLSIHETEQHDVFFKLRQEKERDAFHGYVCLITRCDKRFTSEKTRKRHLIDAHRFPYDFPFNFITQIRHKTRDIIVNFNQENNAASTTL
jgi:uncharacterized C2H2 Zn-finger protein